MGVKVYNLTDTIFYWSFGNNIYSANICPALYIGNKKSKMTLQEFFMYLGSSNYTKQIVNNTDWREYMTTFLNKHSLEIPNL